MAYADLNTIQSTDPGDILTSAWCDQSRDNHEFLIDPPAASVKASAAQSLTSGTTAVLTASSETFDNDGMHSTIANVSRVTIQTAGRYQVSALVRFANSVTGGRHIALLVNGSTNHDIMAVAGHQSGFDSFLSGTKSFVFSAADYIEVRATQHSGVNLNTTLEDFYVKFITR